jgi:F-type H+-transporting ATPase subunit delta
MSFSKKIVTAYAKSLFQTVNGLEKSQSKIISDTIKEITQVDVKNEKEIGNKKKPVIIDVYSIGEELYIIRSLLTTSKELKTYFGNPTITEKDKFNLLLSIFPGLTVILHAFLKVLTEKGDLSLLPDISDQYNEILLKFKGSTTVKLITASTLEESYGLLLLNTLKKITNSKEILLNVVYNPQLLGGFILEYNSISTDASILKEFSLFFNEV